jgi:hypothetical protein
MPYSKDLPPGRKTKFPDVYIEKDSNGKIIRQNYIKLDSKNRVVDFYYYNPDLRSCILKIMDIHQVIFLRDYFFNEKGKFDGIDKFLKITEDKSLTEYERKRGPILYIDNYWVGKFGQFKANPLATD